MAILNGSYKFHTSPTNYTGADWYFDVNFKDNAGTEYNNIRAIYSVYTYSSLATGDLHFFDTGNPLLVTQSGTTFDDIENAPWLILTFDNQEVDDALYEIITNCADLYFDGIHISISDPKGVILATEKTIINKNIKVTVDESLLGSNGLPIEVTTPSVLDSNSYPSGTVFLYTGATTSVYTNGYYYVKE